MNRGKNTLRRASLPALALLAAALGASALAGRLLPAASAAQEPQAARPDLSGVWLPNARASARWPDPRPYTKAMLEKRAQWDKETAPIDFTRDDDYTSCMAYRLPYLLTTITQYPFEILQTDKRIYVFTEVFGQVRRIDLAKPPAIGEDLPSRVGRSYARWEGSQLVVETTNILPDSEGGRYPSSPKLRVIERLSIEPAEGGGRQLINEITIDDPPVYEEPVTIRMVFKEAPAGVGVGEYICPQDIWDQHLDGSSSRIPWR
jgi:hypothetical protein